MNEEEAVEYVVGILSDWVEGAEVRLASSGFVLDFEDGRSVFFPKPVILYQGDEDNELLQEEVDEDE